MSSILERVENKPQETQRLIGLKYDSLQQLISEAEALHNQKQAVRKSGKVRIISKGGGRKPKLSVTDQILLTLVYLRQMTTFQLIGIQFEVSESTANDIFNYWLPLLGELLPASLLELKKNECDYETVKEILTEFELIVDSCEQRLERDLETMRSRKSFTVVRRKIIR